MSADRGGGRGELFDTDTGVWLVVTKHSQHRFDLDARTVVREPGPRARDFGDIVIPTNLDTIESCKVGERGRWSFHPRDRAQPDRYLSSVILRIERVQPDESSS